MDRAAALWIAIDLKRSPSRAKQVRLNPLPQGVLILLRIVAGDEGATREASQTVDRSPEFVREAAAFFIEQILFSSEADSYRVLGAAPGATYAELRRNMALLLRWLHPDLDPKGERAVFTRKVTRAWSDLKSDERRAAYGQSRRKSADQKLMRTKRNRAAPKDSTISRRNSHPRNSKPHERRSGIRRPADFSLIETGGLLRRVLHLLFGRVAL